MMKIRTLALAALAVSAAAAQIPAQAFDFKNPMAAIGGGSSEAPSANAGEVLRNTRNALLSFAKAELGLSQALGGYEDLVAHQKLIEAMKSGDVAAKKEDFEVLIKVHQSANDLIEKKMAENAALDAKNKTLAGKSMVEYAKGLGSARKMVASLQGLAKNPTSLAGDAGTALYAAKEVPTLVTSAGSTTSKLFQYLGSNGVDVAAAQAEADSMGK